MDHASGEGTVTYHGNGIGIRASELVGLGKAQSGGEGSGGVPSAKAVMLAFAAEGKAGEPSAVAQGGKTVPSAGEKLMNVALVTHVENNMVVWGAEYPMQSQGQLHYAEIRGQMSAVSGDFVNEIVAKLFRQGGKTVGGQSLEIIGGMYGVKNRIRHNISLRHGISLL
jgi:hypothetical protein